MRLLLDTHVLLWWLDECPLLSASAKEAIADVDNIVYVSAATVWEIVIKRALGKLELPDDWADVLAGESLRRMPVTWEHAVRVARLPPLHRDPFDRILVAQALVEELVLVTGDDLLVDYGAPTLHARD